MAKSSKKTKTVNYKQVCQVCKNSNYYGKHNKSLEKKIDMTKHCKTCRKHTLHKESKF